MTDKLGGKGLSGRSSLTPRAADSSPTPTARHLAVLDYFRGVAILLVFLGHCPPQLPPRLDSAERNIVPDSRD